MKQRFWLSKTLPIISAFMLFTSGWMLEPVEAAKKKIHSNNFPSTRAPAGKKVFIFDAKHLRWAVYDANGKIIRTGHGVAGKGYCPDIHRGCRTPVGSFTIYQKAGPHFKSSKYPLPHGGAPMPWAMFFRGHYAIHGSNDVPNFHASHGCIRVYPGDARWLSQTLPIGSKVIVKPY